MSPHPFSPAARASALAELAARPLDLLVIGGGITGCGIARHAALRALRVGLLETADFGFGTSSRSTKIIHGGIRYLQYGHIPLVRESARERWVLRRIAPHLVHPVAFVYPLYRGMNRLKYRIGFHLFDVLAGAAGDERHRMVDARETRTLVPDLRDELRGAGVYPEFITDDARLTLENAMSAAMHGALVANHAEVVELPRGRGAAGAVHIRDIARGLDLAAQASVIVNATGAWAERTLRLAGIEAPKHLVPSKGIHLLFHAARLPLAGAAHLRTAAGREGLAIRRGDWVYVGTTDVESGDSLDHPRADAAAIDDVLRMARDCFPALDLTTADVRGTWAGIRPLIAEAGRSTRETSRRDEIWEHSDGLLSVVGGKLTTYRKMADRVMARVLARLDAKGDGPFDDDRSAHVPLPGGRLRGIAADRFMARMAERFVSRGVEQAAARRIAWLYGSRAERLLAFADQDPAWLHPLGPGTPAVRAEARLAVEEEMALTLEDVLDRRLGLLLFSDDHGAAAAEEAANILAERLGWDEPRRQAEISGYRVLARAYGPL